MLDFYGLSFYDFHQHFAPLGIKDGVLANFYKQKTYYFERAFTNSKALPISEKDRQLFHQNLIFDKLEIDTIQQSEDHTTKLLFKLSDGKKVETVIIPFHGKISICLSTQVGCGMNCAFCFTGKQGFKRNLTTSEIILQYLQAYAWARQNIDPKLSWPDIVFMGQGEPLHNFDSLKKAIEILIDQKGIHLGPKQITISTVGYLPGMKRINELPHVNFALSLHSAFHETRSELIPVNQAFSLGEIFDEFAMQGIGTDKYLVCEYLLIKNLNTHLEDVLELKKISQNKKIVFNLIPFNPFPEAHYQRPDPGEVEQFFTLMKQHGMRTFIRTTKGKDILAACGQLNTSLS